MSKTNTRYEWSTTNQTTVTVGIDFQYKGVTSKGAYAKSVVQSAGVVGYEVGAEGRSARRGIELTYEYDGKLRRLFLPSYMAVCAPAGVECEPEHDE